MQTCEYLISTISRVFISLGIILLINCSAVRAETSLADAPVLAASANVPSNVALVLSVEYPTGDTTPYPATGYSQSVEYIGYFDPNKCYSYFASPSRGSYFTPIDLAASNHNCSAITNGRWSGNYLNWAITQVIDPMRKTLTGGFRVIDINGLTVLEKAYADRDDKGIAPTHILSDSNVISQSTPYSNVSTLKVRVSGLDTRLLISSSGDVDASNTGITTFPTNPNANTVYDLMARVEVCKTGLLETNCTLYPNDNYKPTGLIHKHALKLNFAAFGYLNDDDIKRDGGVLRAKMAPLGPTKIQGSSIVTNPTAEWDANTGIFYTNPNSADPDIGGASNSGVINYLNKFGKTSSGYKTFDSVSELFYTAGRYFRKKGNVDEYTNNATATMRDGFPVITNWNDHDPITSSCQANFIIGVGDTRTHADANLPGSNIRDGNFQPTLPSKVSSDYQVNGLNNTTTSYTDVATSTNRVGQMQGLGDLGTVTPLNWCCGTNNTFFIAGLAYDLHTRDFRPDIAGKQTITTFWLDTLELGLDNKDSGRVGMRNQYWLATKYGGFKVPNGYNPYGTLTTLDKSTWDTDVNKNPDGTDNDDPDNYFRANNPAAMAEGLDKTFSAIVNEINGSSISFATSSPSIQTGSLTYTSSYNSTGWTGDVTARQINIDSNGIISTSNPIWSAAAQLESQNWDTGRVIATVNPSKSGCTSATTFGATGAQNNCGVRFRFSNLNTSQRGALGSNGSERQEVLEFLRGNTANEGTKYRNRVQILGDIVNSKVVPIGAPNKPYIDSFNLGYADFKANNASRPTVVYVGANDGMLHAFDGATGVERFAFVPNALFRGPSTPATPATDGLAQLASTAYVHHFYVDATPQVADVTFADGTWHSVLIGGLGKGGKSYFAIDVTNPQNLNTENNLASNVLWEFTHPLMGFTYDTPLVVKTAKYGWVVVLTSGYNNTDGKGYIFIVDPQTGALKETISTCNAPNANINASCGSLANDAGLAHINAFVADARSGLADALYAGDLLGNVWRVDVSSNPANYSALKIATLATASGASQPVTTSPIIEIDNATGKRYVFIGTGKLLDAADLNSTQPQTFYAINDGTRLSFYNSATLPAVAGGFPITRDDMVDATSSLLTGFTQNSAKPMGYFIDLGTNPNNGKPNFINTEMASGAGLIAFAANSVDNTDVCKPTGSNLTYALSYGTGQSALQDAGGSRVTYLAGAGLTTSLNFVQTNFSDPTNLKLINSADNQPPLVFTPKFSTSSTFTQLNWRELPTAD